jgi:hypothetical protein
MDLPEPNCSMQHQNPVGDFDDTGHFLQGASCTIAAPAAGSICGDWAGAVLLGPQTIG